MNSRRNFLESGVFLGAAALSPAFFWECTQENPLIVAPREIPEHTLSLFATYEVSENFGWAFGITQQGKSNISNDKPGLILPEYTRVDFGIDYKITDDLSVQLNIENLTDELYFPHSHSTHQASGRGRGTSQKCPG